MVTLRKAIEEHLLRPVPLQENDGLQSYKDKPWVDYHQLVNQKVALMNVNGAFLYIKQGHFELNTITSSSGIALVAIGEHQFADDEYRAERRKSKHIKVILTPERLDTNIPTFDEVQQTLYEPTFADLAVKAIKHEKMDDGDIISLLVDRRTGDVLDPVTIMSLTDHGLLLEFTKGVSDRARLFMQEKFDGADEPVSLKLFTSDEIKILKKVRKLA